MYPLSLFCSGTCALFLHPVAVVSFASCCISLEHVSHVLKFSNEWLVPMGTSAAPLTCAVMCAQLSPEVTDLLNKIFVIDEKARITIAQIKEHPWYTPPLKSSP